MTRGDASFATLAGYAGGTSVGMVAAAFAHPAWVAVVGGAICIAALDRLHASVPGIIWGGLAGSFAASTCSGTHHALLGSEAAAPAVACWALALAIVADRFPPQADRYPHALGGALFLVTVILALAIGAEVPSWP
jgi:hypothetical protein